MHCLWLRHAILNQNLYSHLPERTFKNLFKRVAPTFSSNSDSVEFLLEEPGRGKTSQQNGILAQPAKIYLPKIQPRTEKKFNNRTRCKNSK